MHNDRPPTEMDEANHTPTKTADSASLTFVDKEKTPPMYTEEKVESPGSVIIVG